MTLLLNCGSVTPSRPLIATFSTETNASFGSPDRIPAIVGEGGIAQAALRRMMPCAHGEYGPTIGMYWCTGAQGIATPPQTRSPADSRPTPKWVLPVAAPPLK